MEQESGKACLRNSYQLYVSNQSIQRTAEKLDRDRNRLGGGFRYYGGDHANRSSGGGDDSFNSVSTAVLVVLGLKERGSPFGEVRPREEVLAEKGQDWKKIDEQLESMKIKEAAKKKESFRKRGFGSGNGRGSPK
ncbi:hypothetical protein HN51_010566 [Arachis hypogaea]